MQFFLQTTVRRAAVAMTSWIGRLRRSQDIHQMPHRRLVVAWMVIGFIFLGSANDIVFSTEHWPFSSYPMYASVRKKNNATVIHVYLIGPDGEEFLAQSAFHPFDRSRLHHSLRRRKSPRTIQRAGQALLSLYSKHGDGKPIRGLRIYECTWELDPWARNANDPERTLLCECLSDNGR